MWVFLRDAMFSVVEHHKDDSILVVRARIKEDLARVFDRHRIYENSSSDYRFRVFVLREEVAQIVRDEVLGIDYTNFKASVAKEDTIRSHAYHKVWKAMNDVQEELYGPQDWDQWWLHYRELEDKEKADREARYEKEAAAYAKLFGRHIDVDNVDDD